MKWLEVGRWAGGVQRGGSDLPLALAFIVGAWSCREAGGLILMGHGTLESKARAGDI